MSDQLTSYTNLTLRVTAPRPGVGKALMFFDIDLGFTIADGTFVGMLTMKGFAYKMSNEGKPYFQAPSKVRTRNGETVKNDRGYDQYDELIVLYGEMGGNPKQPDKFGVTEGGWTARTIILDQAARAYASLAQRPAPAALGATTGQTPAGQWGSRTNAEERGTPGGVAPGGAAAPTTPGAARGTSWGQNTPGKLPF
jgi:hypothetical protein